jgi:hypothetical protein
MLQDESEKPKGNTTVIFILVPYLLTTHTALSDVMLTVLVHDNEIVPISTPALIKSPDLIIALIGCWLVPLISHARNMTTVRCPSPLNVYYCHDHNHTYLAKCYVFIKTGIWSCYCWLDRDRQHVCDDNVVLNIASSIGPVWWPYWYMWTLIISSLYVFLL